MPVDEPLYPVNLRVAGRRCLVVGDGPVAADKVAGLEECGAMVDVVAPSAYERGQVAGYALAIAATDDPEVNGAVFADGEAAGVWVNSADDPERCSFILPARIRQGRLLVTFATGGHSPAVATWLRRRFSEEFGPEYDILIDMVAAARDEIRASGRSTEGLDWQGALDSGMLELIREGRIDEAKERLDECLSSSSD